jgi:NTE family protein
LRVNPLKNVNLALQGGGAHGAFVWGVVDRLLEDGRLAIEAISATGAGAMNAVALAHRHRRCNAGDAIKEYRASVQRAVTL